MQITLDGQGSLQQQICRGLRQAIASGTMAPLSKLAPSRVFAAEHGVSRNTVTAAYDQLVAEGYLQTRVGAGTFVAELQPGPAVAESKLVATEPGWSETVTRLSQPGTSGLLFRQPRQQHRYDFLYGEPSYQDLPLERWARLIGRSARELTEAQLGYGPVAVTGIA
ncbi:MAG: GntR family transcriptional regulator [Pseudomonadales bacterium]